MRLGWVHLGVVLGLGLALHGCGGGTESMPVASPTSTPMPSPPTPTRRPAPVTDCMGVSDSAHAPCIERVLICGIAFCRQGHCVEECTPSPTPTPPLGTPTAITPTPSCVPTLGISSYCGMHCEPCPTIRAGCYAQPCRDCIENPVCAPDEACVPLNPANPGCCTCATATPSSTAPG
jgi:hypothetical protein